MVRKFLNKIRKSFVDFSFKKESDAIYKGPKMRGSNYRGRIRLLSGSNLEVGNNFKYQGDMVIRNNSKVIIGDDCELNGVRMYVLDNAKVELGKGTILSAGPSGIAYIHVENGTLKLEGFNHLKTEILVKFGGTLNIGKYTSIGYNSEIRCEESVTIGSYGLFSYEVCIYDSNTHSVDWKERRQRIEAGYPIGTSENVKPDTRPVVIGDDVWLGKGVTVTKGASIGNRCIVGIRTVVGSGVYPDDSTIVSDKPRILGKS